MKGKYHLTLGILGGFIIALPVDFFVVWPTYLHAPIGNFYLFGFFSLLTFGAILPDHDLNNSTVQKYTAP